MTQIFHLPENHPQRFQLHNEVHARAPIILKLPVKSSFIAITLSNQEKQQERAHLTKLCERYGVTPPKDDVFHLSATLDSFQIRWEQHTEFSTYAFYVQNNTEDPFTKLALELVPVDWLKQLPGKIIVAAHASIVEASQPSISNIHLISAFFSGNPVIGAEVTGGAAQAFTDFKIHADGFSRFLILDYHLKPGQAGRLLQRLFEIEVYRVMALLAFPIAKQLAPALNKTDKQLLMITSTMAKSDCNDGDLLDELTSLAAELENNISIHHYRLSAASAYYHLVEQRIEDLREVRIQGIQTIGEFMKRRLEPAIDTCKTTSNRFSMLSKRINNAGQLLRTRVDISIERQNQALLTSMDLRAKMQLRLQETVEGLSIVAITSYIVSLINSITKAANTSVWFDLDPVLVTGLSIPFVLLFVALAVRRIHKKIHKGNE
ncbi:MAG TPA: DUF3422 domain-containing protein [Methylococcaceae bacterium]|nr:DUF3422 domain-containing protein [Methylococcaceae bacterium]